MKSADAEARAIFLDILCHDKLLRKGWCYEAALGIRAWRFTSFR
jgi:hypothetical protein